MKPSETRWRWTRATGIAVLGLAAYAGWGRGLRQRVGTDFHVFWQAGYDFAHGLPLYQPLPGARILNYPPFAAQVFQVFSLLPMRWAAWLFYIVSVALIFVAIRLFPRPTAAARPRAGWPPLVMALLCSAVFLIDNLDHLQVNLVILVLCLLGVNAVVARKETAGGGWLVAATAIKLTPVFFVMWALIRGGRRTMAAVVGFSALTLGLPVLQRGWHQGLLDLSTYYHNFLGKFAAGRVIADVRNQNLAALVYRATVPATTETLPSAGYSYLPGLAPAAPVIYRVLAVVVFAALLLHLLRLRALHRPVGMLEIAGVFLAAHLLSGITWKAHLVSFLFIGYVFFGLEWRRRSLLTKTALGAAWLGIALIGLGRDVAGARLHQALAGYSAYAWVMLLLFVLSVIWSQTAVSGRREQ